MYYANNDAKFIATSQMIAHTIRVVATLVCIWLKQDVLMLLLLPAMESLLAIIIQWGKFFRDNTVFPFHVSSKTCFYLIKQGIPIILGSIAYTINFKIDQIMVGSMLGDHELGIYSVAVRLSELWYFIPTIISTVLLAKLTVLKAKNYNMYEIALQKYFSWLVLFAYATGIITLLCASPIISLLFGEKYKPAVSVLQVYIWAGIFVNLSILRGIWYVIEENTIYSLYCNVIGALANVLLNALLIPILGGIGAAYATFISYLIYGYISSFIFKELRPIGIMQTKALFLIGVVSRFSSKKKLDTQ